MKPKWEFRSRLAKAIQGSPLAIFVGGVCVLTLLSMAAFSMFARQHQLEGVGLWVILGLFLVGTSQMAVSLMNWIAMMIVSPLQLPRLDFKKGIPVECATMIVIPTMLSSMKGIEDLLETLEIHYLANSDDHLSFALLTDFPDADEENHPTDGELLAQARQGIEALQVKYSKDLGALFFLFHRPRRWNAAEEKWMGYERKRGKLGDLNSLLRKGSQEPFSLIIGNSESLPAIKYVITLDTDTQLPREAARELAATLAHPLNRAVIDPLRRVVTQGYGILQPRLGVSLPTSSRSLFVKLFTVDAGIDPYTRAVSDTYQDLFHEGSFIGKGIYDVDAVEGTLKDRFPENSILSHDLLESCYARSALVSDVELIEQYPFRYLADVDRRRRWIRGDWQILQWALPWTPTLNDGRVTTPLSLLSRWKIFDNLRRSLVSSALFLFLISFWLLFPEFHFIPVSIVVTLLLIPELISSTGDLSRRSRDLSLWMHWRFVAGASFRKLIQALFTLAFLPFDSYMSLDSIVRTLYRNCISHKHRLEWRASSESESITTNSLVETYQIMWVSPFVGIVLEVFVSFANPDEIPFISFFTALWIIAPGIAWLISQPLNEPTSKLSPIQTTFLLMTARKTWWFFDRFVTEQENWLPPDNFQEAPLNVVAPRTSPTNMGFSLLANLAAYDFGYLSAGRLISRTWNALSTMKSMEKHQGHFYNWYDTRTLKPLLPHYISTVDSGNLSGMLLTLASGLRELKYSQSVNHKLQSGLQDTYAVLRESAGYRPELSKLEAALSLSCDTLRESFAMLCEVRRLATEFLESLTSEEPEEVTLWTENLVQQCGDHIEEFYQLAPWLKHGQQVEHGLKYPEYELSLMEISEMNGPAGSSLQLAADLALGRIESLELLARLCEELALMHWGFLYNPSLKLFSVGYNKVDQRLDLAYYDLLASEARLASFIAIAQGDVPQDHWFSLGRLLVISQRQRVLVSWSGSMFEYLMPNLIMPNYVNTLIDKTCIAAVQQQINYGTMRGVPWGISESGYNRTDAHLNYQYKAFGVPGIALKRGLDEDLVIAPYATALALMVSPAKACANLKRLANEGRLGRYGFYEAVDYTPSRMPPNQDNVTIRSFMAHHQGMILLSLVSVLRGKPMQRRFTACLELKSADLLLQERVPRTTASVFSAELEFKGRVKEDGDEETRVRTFTNPQSPAPEVHLLSNGRYHVAITSAGAGFSRWNDLAVTRWREDSTRDCWGLFIYVRDTVSKKVWSVTHQPTLLQHRQYEAVFAQGRAEFRERHLGLEVHTEICVSPEDDVELRRITMTNRSDDVRSIELTSYAEVVMAPPAADAAHPAFSNLFVQTEYDEKLSALFCTRRARSKNEKPPCLLHFLADETGSPTGISYETDRSRFIGRGGTLEHPASMYIPRELSNSTGAVLDPIVSLRRGIILKPRETVTIVFVLGMANEQESAKLLVSKYKNLRMTERAFELAWTHSQVGLRQLNATESEEQLFGRLAGSLIFANPASRDAATTLRRNRRGQSALWAYGISGDTPIVFLSISNVEQLDIVAQLTKAHSYWRMKGLAVELVIVNDDVSTYRQSLHDAIMSTIMMGIGAPMIDKPGGIFVRRHEQIADENLVLLQSVSRIVLDAQLGSIADQMKDNTPREAIPETRIISKSSGNHQSVPIVSRPLVFNNGLGGFTPDGQEYIITLKAGEATPAPWVNVIANKFFGTLISESGGSYTWLENAHEFRLTPWNNDPVQDTSGEAFYIRDDETGEFWSPTPLPARGVTPYVIRHGFGYTVFEHSENGITTELWVYVAVDAPVKFAVLKISNHSGRPRKLSSVGYYEWVLADLREKGLMHAQTELDLKTGAIMARNSYSAEFPDRMAFVDVNEINSYTGDRREFLGRNGRLSNPAGLRKSQLSGKVGAGFDPCTAVMVHHQLRVGEQREVIFRLGVGRSPGDVQELIQRFRQPRAHQVALEQVWAFWNRTLGAVKVETPDPAINMMTNGWLLYQTLSCRMWGRTGFYQSGGAYGFRDQLQDSMALVHAKPELVREHILRAAARQFQQGDVQHWWHPPLGRGVRTHFSDDFLWLPYVTCHYVISTSDTGILDELIPYLDGRPLEAHEESYYDLPMRSERSGTLYEHCVRAIENGMKYGTHGLPLIGCGDWNDGMNKVGAEGRGESVWLGFFFYSVLQKFAKLANFRKDAIFTERCLAESEMLQKNLEQNAWDGEWYHRAYFDNGEPLGSHANDECQIDSIPQSWAVISGAAPQDRARTAMRSVESRLVRREDKLIKLFDPPFNHSPTDPGYIKGYIPGVRENGGQYTHAALWAVMAYAEMGEHDRAWELFALLNPINHGSTPEQIALYKVEPYVVAADVYAVAPHTGRGGWTWYTGSSGWMYQLILNSLLGISLEMNKLVFTRTLPKNWNGFKLDYRYRETVYHINLTQSNNRGVSVIVIMDGINLNTNSLPLEDNAREHWVEVQL